MILIGMVKYSQSFQNASSLCNISKKELEMKLIYCLQINKVSYKMISALCGSKFSTLSLLMIKHSQVLKILSLQYLYNISKKKLGMEFIFCMQIKIKVSCKLALSFLMDRHVRSTKNRELLMFLWHIKKKVLQLLLYSIVMQNIQMFTRVHLCLLLLVFVDNPDLDPMSHLKEAKSTQEPSC